MGAIASGIGAAACWGFADFLGGLRARRLTLATVLLVAGLCQLAGIAALYRALAVGTMSVISPISASGAAALPVVVGVATGERPASLQVAGMAAALIGVVLATRAPAAPGAAGSRGVLALAAIAALGFGGFFVGMDAAIDRADPFWALLVARASAGAMLVLALLVLRPAIGASRADLPSLALIGLLDIGANVCFTLGADTGLLSVVAVLASLYPVTTVVLARALLHERLVPAQAVGVAIALGGVALIAAG